ncbi:MAG: transposase [bacterium]
MPRKSGLDMPGALHHLIIRGIERKKIFRDSQDRENFLIRLGRILVETKTAFYDWALLPNHVHLLLRTGEVPLVGVTKKKAGDVYGTEFYDFMDVPNFYRKLVWSHFCAPLPLCFYYTSSHN